MYFNSVADFFRMGGYAPYVWPAYGIVLFVLVYNVLAALQQKKKTVRKLQRDLIRNNNALGETLPFSE